MSKLNHPHEDIKELFESVLETSLLTNYINVTIIGNDKLKKVTDVKKCTEAEKFKTGDDLNIYVNELIFEQLTAEQQLMVARETIAGYHYDTEKDKLVYTAPDVVTYSGMLSVYSFEQWVVLKESIKTIYTAKTIQEDESKVIAG